MGWRMVVAGDLRERQWTFLTNHAQVRLCIATDPGARLRDVAGTVGSTGRAAQRIVTERVEEGYLERRKVGRRNMYRVNSTRPLRAPFEEHRRVEELIAALSPL